MSMPQRITKEEALTVLAHAHVAAHLACKHNAWFDEVVVMFTLDEITYRLEWWSSLCYLAVEGQSDVFVPFETITVEEAWHGCGPQIIFWLNRSIQAMINLPSQSDTAALVTT